MVATTTLASTELPTTLDRTCLPSLQLRRVKFDRLVADGANELYCVARPRRYARSAAINRCLGRRNETPDASWTRLGLRPRNLQVFQRKDGDTDVDAKPDKVVLLQENQLQAGPGLAKGIHLLLFSLGQEALDLVVDAVGEEVWGIRATIRQNEGFWLVSPLVTLLTEPVGEVDLPPTSHEDGFAVDLDNPAESTMSPGLAVTVALAALDTLGLLPPALFRAGLTR
jgi:hypothetical protein